MAKQVSRKIGEFLKPLLLREGIRCSKYPTIKIVRSSPSNKIELVWTFRQLVDCYDVTRAYLLEMENVQIEDILGEYTIDYLAIVMNRENGGWSDPRVVPGLEEINPDIDVAKLKERAERFAKRVSAAIQFVATVTEVVKESVPH
jgi:hypothetical protein